MTIAEESLNLLARNSINTILGKPPGFAIKAKQKDATRPIGPYADVLVVLEQPVGLEQTSYINDGDDDVKVKIKGMRTLMLSLGFYRDEENSTALDNARKCHIGFVRESIRSAFRSAKVGIAERSQVRGISETLENGWEARAQFDIHMSVVGSDEDIVAAIDSMDIEGTSEQDEVQHTTNILIGDQP